MVIIIAPIKNMKPLQSEASLGLKLNPNCREAYSHNWALAPFMLNYQIGVGWFIDLSNNINAP